MFRLLIVGSVLVTCTGVALSQETRDDVEVERAKAALELASGVARGTTVATQPSRGEPVTLKWRETPLLRWSNPESGSIHGAVFVWTDDDRPEFLASIFKWYSPHDWLDAEVHGLCQQPLVAHRDGQRLWTTQNKSVDVIRLKGAPTPAESPATRRAQMRAILREMSAEQTTRESQAVQPLRLLEAPLYRYQSRKHQILDGGLFAFVWTTDPQIIVRLEATSAGGEPGWQATFVRQTACALRLSRNNERIYDVEQLTWPAAFSNNDLYGILRIEQND